MAPVVDRLKGEYEGRVEFRLVNVEKDPEGASVGNSFGVQYVPSFVFLDTDGSTNDMIVGEVDEAGLRSALDALR